MRIYTRGGDKGRTSLFSGARVDKDDARIEALGSLDELVAALGLAKASPGTEATARQLLEAVQTELYLVMADIAADAPGDPRLPVEAVARLETEIDAIDAELPRLTDFVIPGNSPGSAALHLARTISRRAERGVRSAAREHHVPDVVAAYLNRLADLLFVLARWVDRAAPGGTFKDNL